MERTDSIERVLDRVEAQGVLSPDNVDWDIKNPHRILERFVPTIKKMQKIEQEVDIDVLHALLPGLDEQGTRFLELWQPQENMHGQLLSNLVEKVGGITEDYSEVTTPQVNKLLGNISKVWPSFGEVIQFVYFTRGAMHERQARGAYERLGQLFSEIGEVALAETLIKPIYTQENPHLGYYFRSSQELAKRMNKRQVYAAKKISIATYAPVGSGAKEDKAPSGHAALTLASGPITDSESTMLEETGRDGSDLQDIRLRQLSDPILKIGTTLLSLTEKEAAGDFVHKAVMECVEAAYESQNATA